MIKFLASILLPLNFIGTASADINHSQLKVDTPSARNHWSGIMTVISEPLVSPIVVIETSGDGKPSLISWELSEPINLNERFLETWLELQTYSSWFAIEFRISDQADFSSYYSLPINRYEDPSFNWLQDGAWQKFSFSMGEAVPHNTPDLTRIKYIALYLQDNQRAPLVLSVGDLKLTRSKAQAVLSLTFDDGDISHKKAAEIMSRYGLRGTAYVMPREVGTPNRLTKEDIIEMQSFYGWSISSHHSQPFTDMSPSYIEDEVQFGLDFLHSIGSYSESLHFAYPLGKTNSHWVTPQMRQLFRSARRASGGAETLPPADWHLLRAVNVTPELTPEVLAARIEKAKAHNEWLMLMFHEITEGPSTSDLQYNREQFEKLIDVIHRSGIRVLNVDQVWKSFQVD